ncbi:MAG: ATP-grasp domain-containing protein [Candidatus Lambdaproteobacteria bacterium]|nr:ATP-grasp domain-containing protein [Candidatus Lambdaproteobacteria bacterium]
MANGQPPRRLVFVEAEKVASSFPLRSIKRPEFLSDGHMEGLLSKGEINGRIKELRSLSVDDYIRQTVYPSEHPKRKNAVEVIRQLGGTVLEETNEGPMYVAEVSFRLPERTRRVLFLAQNRKNKNGVWMPRHHRRASELVRFYSSYGTPVVTFIDTPGADAGEEANRNNQAHAISELISVMANLQLPSLGIVFGNGYSGGAIPLATTNVLLSVRDGVFNTIHPMGLAEIAYNYNLSWQECARYIGVSSYELCKAGYLDGVIDYSPLTSDSPRPLTQAIFSALETVEANMAEFLRKRENHYFFQHYQESVLRSLNPSDLMLEENRAANKTPTGLLNVFGSAYRFHRYLKLRMRLSSQSVRTYSRMRSPAVPKGELHDRIERERLERFRSWADKPLEIRYDDALSKRYRRVLDTQKSLGLDRGRFASFFMGTPEKNFNKACDEIVLELGLHLYNFWKVEARENLVLLLEHLEHRAQGESLPVDEATLLDALQMPGVRDRFPSTARNFVLFDLLYDHLVQSLPMIARELRDTNEITQSTMEDLLDKVLADAAKSFQGIFPEGLNTDVSLAFSNWLETLISRHDIEKLMQQVSEWKRMAFPRHSEPLFGILAYFFSNLLPSFYKARRGEKHFEGKINPRNIGIKDFWNRLNQAYRDLLIQNLLDNTKRTNPLTPQRVIDAFFTGFDELNADLITTDPVRFPGFRGSIERALEANIPPVGVITGMARFRHGDIDSRVGLAVSNSQFQAGAFDMASGEKICKLMVECAVKKLPVVMFISSGGMQTKEGAGALFSMSVLNDRLNRFVRDIDLPVICFGFRDCTGGAQASFVTHRLVKTHYLSGAVIPFAGQRVVPSHLPSESVLANYLSRVPESMDGLVANPFDPELDAQLREIDPDIPLPSDTIPDVLARILKGEYRGADTTAADELPKGFITFSPVKRMLIHARGCTASRLIDGAHDVGVEVVLVQSDADMESAPAKQLAPSDRLVCIGGKTPQESYLNGMSVVTIAENEEVDTIHPGIGFLSENPNFALLCRKNGFNFVGPRAYSMELMGNKSNAIATALRLDVKVVPGSQGVVTDPLEAQQLADEIGYPVLIKAAFGGGGKGMRVVFEPENFKESFLRTSQEALSAFGNGDVYLEKFVTSMRHVEVQVLRDRKGNTRILGLRDCSVQRDNQKLIEESGSFKFPKAMVDRLFDWAEKIANEIDYIGAGTIEFIYDRAANDCYFMEMNTRLQVEHPVTEAVADVDIVREQLRIAAGESIAELVPKSRGYAMEVRINAEQMSVDSAGRVEFRPSPGVVTRLVLPEHPDVRIVKCINEGDTIPPFYDSLIVQVIAHGRSRAGVIKTLRAYLGSVAVEGVYTNLALMEAILGDEVFTKGDYDTGFIRGFFERADLGKLLARMEKRSGSGRPQINREAIVIENSEELKVLSPRTGVFYAAPSPDDPPFVEIGDVFDVHKTLCLMEAMKVFEGIRLADYNVSNGDALFAEDASFTVTRVLAESGQTVNQGDLLFIVKPLAAEPKPA